MRTVDLATFIANGRYQYDEEVEVNHFEPRTGGGSGRRTAFRHCSVVLPHGRPIATICNTSEAERRPSHKLTSSDSLLPACAPQLATTVVDHNDAVSWNSREEERETYTGRERATREREDGEGRERDEGGTRTGQKGTSPEQSPTKMVRL